MKLIDLSQPLYDGAPNCPAHPPVKSEIIADHPQHAIAARQMQRGFGSMLSIQVGGGPEAALGVIRRLRVWVPATSLGGVESLVEHRFTVEGPTSPAPPDLLRLSVGIEDPADLIGDLEQALARAG